MDAKTPLDRLRELLAVTSPATGPAIAVDAYPGLKVTRAPAASSEELDAAVAAAFEAAGWPDGDQPFPLAGELTAAQRALADLLAGAAVPLHARAIPQATWARRRWLGLDPPGVLDREVDGASGRVPLWRALQERAADDDDAARRALVEGLSLAERLEVHGDLVLGAYRLDPPADELGPLGDAGRAWAPAYADRLIALFAPDASQVERGDFSMPPGDLCALVMRALVEAGVAIEARWDSLVPLDLDVMATLPAARRDAVLVARLADEFPRAAIRTGLAALERFPSAALVDHLLARADQCTGDLMCPPRRTVLAQLRELVAGDPTLAARVDARIAALPPLPELRCTSQLRPSGVEQLTPGQRRMLEILGQGWEGDEGPIVTDDGDGQLTIGELTYVSAFAIAGADGDPQFEALLYMDEDGAVCRVDSTNSVAYVSQMRLSWNIDEPTVEALHAILRVRPPRPDRA